MSRQTTVTLDDDVATKLDDEVARAQRPFGEVLNETLRRGLEDSTPQVEKRPFKVRAHDFGFKPGLDFSCTSRLLEELDRIEELDRLEKK